MIDYIEFNPDLLKLIDTDDNIKILYNGGELIAKHTGIIKEGELVQDKSINKILEGIRNELRSYSKKPIFSRQNSLKGDISMLTSFSHINLQEGYYDIIYNSISDQV